MASVALKHAHMLTWPRNLTLIRRILIDPCTCESLWIRNSILQKFFCLFWSQEVSTPLGCTPLERNIITGQLSTLVLLGAAITSAMLLKTNPASFDLRHMYNNMPQHPLTIAVADRSTSQNSSGKGENWATHSTTFEEQLLRVVSHSHAHIEWFLWAF